jgi:hypothetical protein
VHPTFRCAALLGLFASAPGAWAEQAEQARDSGEPAGFFLLLLGLLAVLLGIRNLRTLRSQSMIPPRPKRRPETDQRPDAEKPSDKDAH